MSAAIAETDVDLDRAVRTALKFFRDSFGLMKPADVQLEEIELSEDGRVWLITVGFDNPAVGGTDAIGNLLSLRPRPTRKYKVVRVDAKTGRPVSIKIRPGL